MALYFPYDEMDDLTPRRLCGSHRYWFDGDVWQCWNSVPPPWPDTIRVEFYDRRTSLRHAPEPLVSVALRCLFCTQVLRQLVHPA